MKIVNIHQAKTHLSRLVDEVMRGEEAFIIAKAGKPMVKVSRLEPQPAKRRLGTMRGKITVPEDFDTLMQKEIEDLFYGEREK